jgi:hypothetical protein
MIAFGASSVIQGAGNTVLAIAVSDKECPNPLQECFKAAGGGIGYLVGGEEGKAKGAAITVVTFSDY